MKKNKLIQIMLIKYLIQRIYNKVKNNQIQINQDNNKFNKHKMINKLINKKK